MTSADSSHIVVAVIASGGKPGLEVKPPKATAGIRRAAGSPGNAANARALEIRQAWNREALG